MAKVLLVAEAESRPALQAALEALKLEVAACTPREAAGRVHEAEVVAVAGFPDDATAPRFVTHLLSSRAGACPPVVVQVLEKAAARDATLIAGAADVSFDPDADHFAGRVAAVVSRWARGARKMPVGGIVRGQSGRTALELKVAELDATGLGLASTAGVSPRQLVRLQLPLASGPLLVWGRVAQSEGVAGVRFLGLSALERARVTEAVGAIAATEEAAEKGFAPAHPGPPPAEVAAQASLSAASATAPVAEPDPEPLAGASEPEDAPPTAETSAGETASTDSAQTTADVLPDEAPESTDPPPASEEASPPADAPAKDETSEPEEQPVSSEVAASPPDVAEAGADDAPSASAVPSGGEAEKKDEAGGDLSSLIGSALDDELSGGSEGDMLASILGSGIVRRWPETEWTTEACIEVLRHGAPVGLVSDVENAPTGETVLAFLRTLTPMERRAFDAVPPPELPPSPLTTRCLALRLRCFALVENARSQPEDGPGWVIDHVPLTALRAEADLARSELQKLADTLMAEGETQRLRDVNNFANALHKAYTDVTVEAARLRGEAVTRDRAVLLDVAENEPSTRSAPRAKPGKAVEKGASSSPTSRDFRKKTPEERARRRLIGWGLVLVASVALRVALWPEGVRTLEPGELRAVPGVVEVKLPPPGATPDRPQAAAVSVVGTWRADDAVAMEKLKTFLRGKGVKRFAVFDGTGSLLATGGTGATDKVIVTEIPAP